MSLLSPFIGAMNTNYGVDPWQETAAEALLAADADLVIGHHPHMVQPVTVDRQHTQLVAYSLGNFVFDQAQEALAPVGSSTRL